MAAIKEALPVDSHHLQTEFRELVVEWKTGRKGTTTARRMAEHPAYQRIIAMGWDAVPLIVDELARETDHWFIALHAITKVDPVPEENRGEISKMAQAWIAWWRDGGHAR